MDSRPIPHPFEEDLGFLYGVIFIGPPGRKARSFGACTFRARTAATSASLPRGRWIAARPGRGVSARLAIHHARGEIDVGELMTVESIIGARFTGRIVDTTTFGPYPAVIPELRPQLTSPDGMSF